MRVIVLSVIVCCIALFSTCIERDEKAAAKKPGTVAKLTYPSPDFNEYSGSEKCKACHQETYRDFVKTAHARTSDTSAKKTIRGSFAPGKNTFSYSQDVSVAMEERDSGLFQVIYYQGHEKLALPFNLNIGSGTKGQSFVYWKGDHLLQLPVTYYSVADQWANSPGYPNKVMYNRPITARCLECHSTFAEVISPPGKEPESFDRSKILTGVGCEKCHGPGSRHIEFYETHKADDTAKFIVNPSSLSRMQNMDLCALCHGGRKEKIRPNFSFKAGDTLSLFFGSPMATYATVDVHGNQVALLESSECFKQSGTMTCNTCHSPHANERGKLSLFSKKCMSCHQQAHTRGPGLKAITDNCIDCHMPSEPSRNIVLQTDEHTRQAALFRSHHIAVYPDKSFKN